MFLLFLIGMIVGVYIDQELERVPQIKPIVVNIINKWNAYFLSEDTQPQNNKEM